MSRDDMFSRWSERKRRVAEESTPEPEAAPEPAPDIPEPQTEEEEAELLARLGLPRPEEIGPGDAAQFLRAQVPEFLRRRALRALWTSHPTFAVLDGLNDYDDDFRSPELNKKVVATAYQVGKGILRKVETALAEPEAETAGDEEATGKEEATGEEEAAQADPAVAPIPVAAAERPREEPEDDTPPDFAPRRMTFET